MSDRAGAELFSEIFQMIYDHVEDEDARYQLARRFFAFARDYDFSFDQLDADDILVELGLAHYATDNETGEDIVRYEGE